MSALWAADAMVEAMGGRPLGSLPQNISGISIDSRTLKPGEAFFAIKGENFDGHDFATAAVKAGAALLVISEAKLPALGRLTVPMIVVEDVLKALERLGAAARARSNAKIIAVTGSAGKTTTKEALRHVLGRAGKVHASDKSFNNHWGVPLTLARMPADCNFAVFEIGMNHAGEIRPLVKLVQPHIALVTLIAPAHLGHFKNLDEIAEAKAEIFEGVVPGGHALINRDDQRWKLLEKLARKAGVQKVLGFGGHAKATYRLAGCELHAEGSIATIAVGGKEMIVRIGAPGRHIVQNVLAVIGAAHLAGADLAKVAPALGDLSAERGRGKRYVLSHPQGPVTRIDESYNANPASMRAAIELLDTAPVSGEGRRIAVLGDMLELGEHSAELHAKLADIIAQARIDMVFLAGREMKALADKLPVDFRAEYRQGVEELTPVLLQSVQAGDAVMIKSSNGIGFSKLVDALIDFYPAAGKGLKTA
jgi:UDP-N-acetylmuramoyl-tripeptide--D-alanyl-D-alanine ligase